MNIYVHKDGTQYGPYSLEQLQQYLQQGSFTLQDQACHDGQNWVTIAQVPGVAQATTPPSETAAQQAQTVAPKQAVAKRLLPQKQNKPLPHLTRLDNKRLKKAAREDQKFFL